MSCHNSKQPASTIISSYDGRKASRKPTVSRNRIMISGVCTQSRSFINSCRHKESCRKISKLCTRRKPARSFRCLSSYTEGYLASLASKLKQQKEKGPLPSLELNHVEAVERQLQVLQQNNTPYPDHGVEILYRYSSFDPFQRSLYFGRSLDLGQFERFRRIFHTPTYSILLCHREHKLVSSLKVSDHKWKQRVEVVGIQPNSSGCFTFTMVQWVGGHFDGIWFCESLVSDSPMSIHT